MPEAVYSTGPGTNEEFDTDLLRFVYQSYVTPRTTYDYDVAKRTRTLLKQQPVLGGYDPAQYDSAMLMAPAKDGTKVPVSLVWKKSLRTDGPQPLLLYGYGSYGMAMPASFAATRSPFSRSADVRSSALYTPGLARSFRVSMPAVIARGLPDSVPAW